MSRKDTISSIAVAVVITAVGMAAIYLVLLGVGHAAYVLDLYAGAGAA